MQGCSGDSKAGPSGGLERPGGGQPEVQSCIVQVFGQCGGDGSEGGEVRVGLELGVVGAGWGL